MLTEDQLRALTVFAPAAVAAERETGFPAECLTAAWAAETGWSLTKVTGDWNLFGLTAAGFPDRPKKFCPTREELTLAQFVLLQRDERESVTKRIDLGNGRYRYWLSRWFACFTSLPDGLSAYVKTITAPGRRYSKAWDRYQKDHDIDAFLDGIAAAGFATGAGYGSLLRQIAHQQNVQIAVQAARQKFT